MTKKLLFGTDGIRGKANIYPLDPESAVKIGKAIAAYFKKRNGPKGKAVIGMDPRISSGMLANSVSAGIQSMGTDVLFLGVVTTPLVSSYVTGNTADFGIVISASHNPYDDNGIKIFNGKGTKLNDNEELKIESIYFNNDFSETATADSIGKFFIVENGAADYVSKLISIFKNSFSGSELKASIDCANGAAFSISRKVFDGLFKKTPEYYSTNPDGININSNCGALHPAELAKKVLADKSDIGIAFDGDGDRFIAVDEFGTVVDGDIIIGICADHLNKNGRLKNGIVVTTVMSNAGLEKYLFGKGIKMIRTSVGDRYVFEEMLRTNAVLGGENSGHIIFSDINPTGDGIVAALTILEIMTSTGLRLSELAKNIQVFPQIMSKLKVAEKKPLNEIAGLEELIRSEELKLDGGRMLVRYSGTEPVLRIMAEGPDTEKVKTAVNNVAKFINDLK
ncbi:MAG TPA: phosphoglucosamine mutase [bacterium]|nr:phosphoglucosamine mutase [bacterium]HPS30579.1 phosphoglucosamine mutase [bacterium]